MGYNIEWMNPEITEVWSVEGRLYQSEKAARRQYDQKKEWFNSLTEKHGEGWWSKRDIKLYKVTLTHEVIDS